MSRSRGHWFVFRGSELLVRVESEAALLPREQELKLSLANPVDPVDPHAVGELLGEDCWAVELPAEAEAPEGMTFQGLRKLWGLLAEDAWRLAGRAVQIVDWDRNHRFCGRCGTPTERQPRSARGPARAAACSTSPASRPR